LNLQRPTHRSSRIIARFNRVSRSVQQISPGKAFFGAALPSGLRSCFFWSGLSGGLDLPPSFWRALARDARFAAWPPPARALSQTDNSACCLSSLAIAAFGTRGGFRDGCEPIAEFIYQSCDARRCPRMEARKEGPALEGRAFAPEARFGSETGPIDSGPARSLSSRLLLSHFSTTLRFLSAL